MYSDFQSQQRKLSALWSHNKDILEDIAEYEPPKETPMYLPWEDQ